MSRKSPVTAPITATTKPEVRRFHVSFDVEFRGLESWVTPIELQQAITVDFDDIEYRILDRLKTTIHERIKDGAK